MSLLSLVDVNNEAPVLRLTPYLLNALAKQYASTTIELCGFLAGPAHLGSPDNLVIVTNVSPTPRVAYEMAHPSLIGYAQYIEDEGLQTYAAFHSHVENEATPSRRDVELAAPGLSHQVIVGIGPTIAAFVGDFSLPAAIIVVDDHHHCVRCNGCIHLDHLAPVSVHRLCHRELS